MSNTEEDEDHGRENFAEAIALVRGNLNIYLKKLDRRWRTNDPYKVSDISPLNIGKIIQCHECEGFGHIKVECPTFLNK